MLLMMNQRMLDSTRWRRDVDEDDDGYGDVDNDDNE